MQIDMVNRAQHGKIERNGFLYAKRFLKRCHRKSAVLALSYIHQLEIPNTKKADRADRDDGGSCDDTN